MPNPIMIEDLRRIHTAIGATKKFRDATVVVTGCAGFLGFYIMQFLARYSGELGLRRVIGLDNFLLGALPWIDALTREFPGVVEVRYFNISKNPLVGIEGAAEATFIIHGASVASPTFYRRYPIETIDANIWGLRNLLDFYSDRPSLRGLLFFSSSEVYGDPDLASIPTDESFRGYVACAGPRACYDESKRFGETLCYVYAKIYGMPITVARPFNNYGPGMGLDDQRLPADFAKCVVEGRDIIILSDGTPSHYVPGTRIPIVSDHELSFALPDHLPMLNLAWHIKPEIETYLRNAGFRGRLIDIIAQKVSRRVDEVPIPEQAAHDSGMMPPTHSEIIPPTVPR